MWQLLKVAWDIYTCTSAHAIGVQVLEIAILHTVSLYHVSSLMVAERASAHITMYNYSEWNKCFSDPMGISKT